MDVAPIACLRPDPARAAGFVCPPYDVFDRAQARAWVAAHPESFLPIDRPETCFPPEYDMYAPEVYEKAAALLQERVDDGTLVDDAVPCFYLWQMRGRAGEVQEGVVCGCLVTEYLEGTICRHELTRPEHELDRARHMLATHAQTGAILLTYRDSARVAGVLSRVREEAPLYGFSDAEGLGHRVWRISRPELVCELAEAFANVPRAYIADGHHRAAAAARVYEGADVANRGLCQRFLAVLFPAGQMRILSYNRVARGVGERAAANLLSGMERVGFSPAGADEDPSTPWHRGEFCVYAGGRWQKFSFARDGASLSESPVDALDVSILQERVLGPLLGVCDPRTNPRLLFVGDTGGARQLEQLAGRDGVAFRLYPTSVAELMRVSDAGLLMPPKSTWFEPKLKSGLFIRRI